MISAQTIEAFNYAQKQAIALLVHGMQQIRLGMSEVDILNSFEHAAPSFGFQGFLRRPVVHINYRPSLRWGPSNTRQIQKGSVVQLHLQPCTTEAFGNIGLSFTFDSPNLPIVDKARDICIATCTFAGHTKKSGELLVFAQSWATNHRTELNRSSIGHFCFAKEDNGLFAFTWPNSMRLFTQLRRYQLQWFNPRPLYGIYAIHPEIKQDNRRVGFAELILVTPEDRIVLGRDSLEKLCSFD